MVCLTRGNDINARTRFGQESSTELRRDSAIVKSRSNKELDETKSKSGIRLKRSSEQIVTKLIQKPQSNNYKQHQSFANQEKPAVTSTSHSSTSELNPDDGVLPSNDDNEAEKFKEKPQKFVFVVKESDDNDFLCLDTPPGAGEPEEETQDGKLSAHTVVGEATKDNLGHNLSDELLDFLMDGGNGEEESVNTEEQGFDELPVNALPDDAHDIDFEKLAKEPRKLALVVEKEVNKDSTAITNAATTVSTSTDDCDLDDLDFLNDGENNVDNQDVDTDDEFKTQLDALGIN